MRDRGSAKTVPSLHMDQRLATENDNAVEIKLVGVGPAKIASASSENENITCAAFNIKKITFGEWEQS